jgi:hypothetical protein
LMTEIREALHLFHGKGKICVVSIQGGVDRRNKVEVHHGDQFRFSFALMDGYIQFVSHQMESAWAFNDPCERTERTLKGLATSHMANVIMEQDIKTIEECENM